jgi:hypothetical protein
MRCSHCGHALSAAELEGQDCPYCRTVLPHRARAAEKVAVLQSLLADRDGDGVPDVAQQLGKAAVHVFPGNTGAPFDPQPGARPDAPPPAPALAPAPKVVLGTIGTVVLLIAIAGFIGAMLYVGHMLRH